MKFQATNGSQLELRPIFILDATIARTLRVGSNRWRFLIQSLEDLDASLKALGSRLFVLRGTPEEVFQKLFKEWSIKVITFESDIEPYSIIRDKRVEEIARQKGIEVIQCFGHTLLNPYL